MTGRICVAGAGSIGCYVGGMLAAAGRDVALFGRPRIVAEIADRGLTLSRYDGANTHVAAERLRCSDQPDAMRDAETVLVTVKSADTAAIAETIAQHAPRSAVIVSLQNGVRNTRVLRNALPGRRVRGAMTPFNVVERGDGVFHRSTSGRIVIEDDAEGTAKRLSTADLPFVASHDIVGVQWGKLLVNLNNALNALSGLPLKQQLAMRDWRALLADQMDEALAAMRAANIRPIGATPVPPRFAPHLLRLPDGLFNALLGRTMTIDADARSSMWDDLQRGRRTEIDFLQGEIAALAERHGLHAPLTRAVIALVRDAEAAGQGSPHLEPQTLRSRAR